MHSLCLANLYVFMFQAMAARDQDYSDFEDQNDSEFSDNDTEYESPSSSGLSHRKAIHSSLW